MVPEADAGNRPKNRYHGAFAVNSPQAITSDGVERLFVAVPGAIRIFGLKGEALGIINGAWEGIIVEPSDMAYYEERLYVTDAWSGHIAVLDLEGNILDTYGARGSGAKEFMEPSGIFIQEGLIYVSDRENSRVQVLSLDGVFLGFAGEKGEFPAKLRKPTDLVVDDRGIIYVVDVPEQWVKLFHQDGQYIDKLTHMRMPVAISRSGNGIAVMDLSSGIVRRFDRDFRSYGSIGAWGRDARQIKGSTGMATAGKYIFVSDPANNEIKRFSMIEGSAPPPGDGIPPRPYAVMEQSVDALPHWPGKLVRMREEDGALYMLDLYSGGVVAFKGGEFSAPVMLAGCTPASFALGPAGRIFCLDADAGKVVVSTVEGQWISEFPLEQEGVAVSEPVDIAVASDGTLLVADRKRGQVLVYDAQGRSTGVLGLGGTNFYIQEPVALSIDENDTIYVSDARSRSVLLYSLGGRLLRSTWDNREVREPGAVAVSESYIFLLDMDRPDVKVFSKNGTMIFSFGAAGSGNGDFYIPASLTALSDNVLLISDTGNGRLQRIRIEPLKWQRPDVRIKSKGKENRDKRREILKAL